MDDLIKCLYEFMMENRLGSLCEDSEYKARAFDAEIQEQRFRESLDRGQQEELDRLLDRITTQNIIADEHIFRAALALSKELDALVRA